MVLYELHHCLDSTGSAWTAVWANRANLVGRHGRHGRHGRVKHAGQCCAGLRQDVGVFDTRDNLHHTLDHTKLGALCPVVWVVVCNAGQRPACVFQQCSLVSLAVLVVIMVGIMVGVVGIMVGVVGSMVGMVGMVGMVNVVGIMVGMVNVVGIMVGMVGKLVQNAHQRVDCAGPGTLALVVWIVTSKVANGPTSLIQQAHTADMIGMCVQDVHQHFDRTGLASFETVVGVVAAHVGQQCASLFNQWCVVGMSFN